MSSTVGMPAEEVQDSTREDVVAIASDHMPGAADVGEFDLRETGEELIRAFLTHQVAHLAADQQHRHAATQDRVNGRMHPVGVGDLEWGEWGGAADELRIPVPVPPITAAAQVGG